MTDMQQINNDALMLAVQFANKSIGATFTQYQLDLAADLLRGKAVPADLRWCAKVEGYYHGAILGSAAAKQQQGGQVASSTAPIDGAVKVNTLDTSIGVVHHAALMMCAAFDAYKGNIQGPGAGDLVAAHRSLQQAIKSQIGSASQITPSATTIGPLLTADDFLTVWAPRFGITARERADVAAQLVHGEITPMLAAKDALLASQSAQIAELQAKLTAADPTPTEDDNVRFTTASLLDESKFMGHYMNMSRKGLVAAVIGLTHDVRAIAEQRDRLMDLPDAQEVLVVVRSEIAKELDKNRDDVGDYLRFIDEAIKATNGLSGDDNDGESKKLNRAKYVQLVNDDLAWLLKHPRTLERDHIEAIVHTSVDVHYPATPKATTASPCGPCQGSGKLWDSNWHHFDKCNFCCGSGSKLCANNGEQEQQPSKYDITEKDPAKRAKMVAACLNERGVLRGRGHPEARVEFVNDYHMVRFTTRMSSIVDWIEHGAKTILQLAMEIEESDEAYRRGHEMMQQARK